MNRYDQIATRFFVSELGQRGMGRPSPFRAVSDASWSPEKGFPRPFPQERAGQKIPTTWTALADEGVPVKNPVNAGENLCRLLWRLSRRSRSYMRSGKRRSRRQ